MHDVDKGKNIELIVVHFMVFSTGTLSFALLFFLSGLFFIIILYFHFRYCIYLIVGFWCGTTAVGHPVLITIGKI